MRRNHRPALIASALGLCLLAGLAWGGIDLALGQGRTTASAPTDAVPTPTQLLTGPLPSGGAQASQLAKGRDLVAIGDCLSCHTRDGGEPLAGGLGMNTPFGVIYSPNLTADPETGIGGWSPDQFYRAMHNGVGIHGERLYPAFPYPYFTATTRADSDALLAYLKTVPAVRYTPPANRLPFPLNMRFVMRGWNLLFFRAHDLPADPSKSAAWNRGAYIVNGLGHCGGCHTPKNALGADKADQPFRGGALDNWLAPDLTRNGRTGLGSWSTAEIVEYLRTGRSARAQAGGPMAELVSYSTSLMSGSDLAAVAAYLKDQPASPAPGVTQADAGAMRRGGAVYEDACASCHLMGGAGQPRYFPPMKGDAMAQQANPTGLVHLILAGGRTGPSPTRPTPLSMPSFAWKLSDQEVADVSTYIRNSWGNQADAVSAAQVAKLRRRLGLETTHLTDNSGDHF